MSNKTSTTRDFSTGLQTLLEELAECDGDDTFSASELRSYLGRFQRSELLEDAGFLSAEDGLRLVVPGAVLHVTVTEGR